MAKTPSDDRQPDVAALIEKSRAPALGRHADRTLTGLMRKLDSAVAAAKAGADPEASRALAAALRRVKAEAQRRLDMPDTAENGVPAKGRARAAGATATAGRGTRTAKAAKVGPTDTPADTVPETAPATPPAVRRGKVGTAKATPARGKATAGTPAAVRTRPARGSDPQAPAEASATAPTATPRTTSDETARGTGRPATRRAAERDAAATRGRGRAAVTASAPRPAEPARAPRPKSEVASDRAADRTTGKSAGRHANPGPDPDTARRPESAKVAPSTDPADDAKARKAAEKAERKRVKAAEKAERKRVKEAEKAERKRAKQAEKAERKAASAASGASSETPPKGKKKDKGGKGKKAKG